MNVQGIVAVVNPQMNKLTTELAKESNTWTLKLIGDFNASVSNLVQFNQLLNDMVKAQAQILIIDLAALEVIDAYGLGLLLTAKKEFAERDIQIVLKNPNPHLRRLFRIMQFERIFEIEPDDSK